MQVLLLAGGFGTRLAEETDFIPKPMVEIGGVPILHHIINYYSNFGHTDFIIALGYKSEVIIEYFNKIKKSTNEQGLVIQLVDTGLETSTGGRIKRVYEKLETEFFMTYGDGLSNVNLDALLKKHQESNVIATLTAVKPPPRFGTIEISNGLVTRFSEKNPADTNWINGGFFCMKKEICDYIPDDKTALESEPLNNLVINGQLGAYEHDGWWHPMDTLRDKRTLEEIWQTKKAPWLKS